MLQSLCKYFWCYLEYLWKGSQVRIDDAAGMSKGVLFVTVREEKDYNHDDDDVADDDDDHDYVDIDSDDHNNDDGADGEDDNDDDVHNVQGDQRDFLLELCAERPEIQVD